MANGNTASHHKGAVQCSLLILCETVSQRSKNVRKDVSWACFSKVDNVGAERMSSSRLLQATGRATQNAQLTTCPGYEQMEQ